MNGCMGRKTAVGLVFTRGGSIPVFREENFEDRSIKDCNRLGCSTRLYSMNGIQTGHAEKVKHSRGSFHSMNSKKITGSSSVSVHACDHKNTHQERRRQTSTQGRALAESSNRQREVEDLDCEGRRCEVDNLEYHSRTGEPEDSESNHITRGNQTVLSDPDELGPVNLQGFSGNASEASGSCSSRLSSRVCEKVRQQCRDGDQETSSSSSTGHSLTSRNTSQASKHASIGRGVESKRNDLKHIRSTSSDILPSGCSSTDSGVNRRVNTLKKRTLNGGSSSVRGQSKSASLSGANSGSPNSGSSVCSVSRPEHLMPQQALSRTGAVLVRSCQSPSGVTRTRLSKTRDSCLSATKPVTISQMRQTNFSAPASRSSRSHTGHRSPISQPEDSSTQMFNFPVRNRNRYRHSSMEGIAEQQLELGMNLSSDALNFRDQYRGMRMNIDNMTYEELLALGEKMGNVSTALTEEALSKCLEKSIYEPAHLDSRLTCYKEDIKCIICQDEYVDGDEVGKLACRHHYHITCIRQWLGQKNWCPICKASACPVS